jgi:hypothetical protein
MNHLPGGVGVFLSGPDARIGDDTILALADMAAISKLKLRQTPPPTLPAAPLKVTQCTCLAESSNPLLPYPIPIPGQTTSQTTIHTQDITNAPLRLKVVTPRTLATCPKTTSEEWTPPTWPSPSETTIGLGSTNKTPSSAPSPGKKWNTWYS